MSSGRAAPSIAAKTSAAPSNYAIDPNLQLTYHGGPVMHTHAVHLIFWLPSGFQYGSTSGDSTTYESDIEQFVQDVSADSGKTSNAFGAISQYKDSGGPAQYSVSYGGATVVTTSFPTSGCSEGSGPCLTDQQLITEIDNAVTAQSWPSGLADEYALLLPNGVTTCTDNTNSTCSDNFFCAYHSAYNHGGNTPPFIYLNLPYEPDVACHADGINPGAQPEPHTGNADTTIDDMSHEEREAATDPLGNAWFDSAGNEADDKCIDTYGSLVGSNYNQPINGNAYDTQTEWSNAIKGCYQMGAPVVTLDQTSAASGASVGISGQNFYAAFGSKPVVTFNKTAVDPGNVTVDSPTHLTVVVPSGNVTGKVTVQAIGGIGTSTNNFGAQPVISNIPDNHDVTGTKIEIDGTGFFGVKSVTFSGVAGTFSSVAADGTSLMVVVPPTATTGPVIVTASGGASAPSTFTVTPMITTFTPAKAAGGASVTINGSGLNGATEVDFGGAAAPFPFVSDTATKIVAKVPGTATSGSITVSNGTDLATTGTKFFTPIPGITSLSILDGEPGDTVHILGGPFNCSCSVSFGTTPAALVTPVSQTEVDAKVPGVPFSSGKVTLTTSDGKVISSQTFAITKATGVSPPSAAANALISVNGQGLGDVTGIEFNGHTGPVLPSSRTATAVKVAVPPDALDGVLTIDMADGGTITTPKPFKPLPKIVSFDQPSYQAGDTVTVTGTNLLVAGPVSAKLGAVAVNPTNVTATSFQFVIPDNAITGTVMFKDAAGTTTSTAKVDVVPTITGDPVPNESTVGSKIVLSGETFTGTTSVMFGADTHKAAAVVGAGGTTLTVTIPPTATSGKVSVTNAGGTTRTANDFTLDPVVTKFTPASGPTGTQITVTGTGFTNATCVMFTGGVMATPTNVTPTSLKVVVPAGALPGPIAVETQTGSATATGSSASSFDVTLSAIGLDKTYADYGATVTIAGVGFGGAVTEVDFNGIAGTDLNVTSATTLTVDVPASGDVTGQVTVKAGSTTVDVADGVFTLMHIDSVSRSSALPGSSITITGTGFTGASDVTFGGSDSAGFSVDSDTQITVTVPSGETGTLEVSNGGGTADAPSTFTIDSLSGVVINEVETDSGGGFIELYSPNGAVDLRGAMIVFRPAAATDSSTDVTLLSYVDPLLTNLHFYSVPVGNIPSTTGGGLALEYPDGTIVDSMGYGTATNAFVNGTAVAAPATGHSVGRSPDGNSTGNNDSVDFVDESTTTPGAANN